ncbi:MAG: nicotinate-nucleotide adenylyltransferase [Elusimicrobia bacterium]|nr:nicotinate-nucleotide adenylyltransferase [Elusimicrobiota bacterium]
MIGLFGGCFNPPHIGHLVIAQQAMFELDLKKVIFIPSGTPPHKKVPKVSAEARFKMTILATSSNSDFDTSDWEIKKSEKTFTIDALKHFKNILKDDIVFIMGSDSLADIKTWKNYEAILSQFQIAAGKRPGADFQQIDDEILTKVKLLENPEIPISSTLVRDRISKGMPYRYLVGDRVYKFIEAMGFYR